MSDPTEDQRLALANMHALAMATLRARDAAVHRAHLGDLADYAPEPIELGPGDPRSDAALAAGVEPAPAARRLAATLRGLILGAAAHTDTVRREVAALARELVGAQFPPAEVDRRAFAALEVTRAELERDVVRLGSVPPGTDAASTRRWGSVRTLELNAFAAAFTRDGTHPRATHATSQGRDAGALRFAMAVAQAALTLAREDEPDAALQADMHRVDAALPALLASLIARARVSGGG